MSDYRTMMILRAAVFVVSEQDMGTTHLYYQCPNCGETRTRPHHHWEGCEISAPRCAHCAPTEAEGESDA